jgi:sulfide dehydrogenase cytochrome subunit
MKKLVTYALVLAMPFLVFSASASELTDKCDNCHGKDGNSEDGKVPNIAGFSEVFLQDTLTEYKEGERLGVKYKPENGDETDMAQISQKLSDSDINAVAKHYASKSFAMHEQTFDAAMAAKGKKKFKKKCDKCHADGGTDPDDDAGLLLGQWRPYLEQQVKAFTSGDRSMPKKMKKKFKKLSDKDKANIIEYLVSGK